MTLLGEQAGRIARTYGVLDIEGGAFVIRALAPHAMIRFKDMFRRIPRTAVPPVGLSISPEVAADLAWFMDRYPMEMTPEASAALSGGRLLFAEALAERDRILMPDYQPRAVVGLREGQSGRGYQLQSVDLLRSRGAQLLADKLGLGKTNTALLAAVDADARPVAVVVEPHLQRQWLERIASFTTLAAHPITVTRPYSLPAADVYVWRYSNLSGWVDVIREMSFGLAVWDEIQTLRKGEASQMGRASMILASRAARRLGLSATPIYNYGSEIWEIMRFLDETVLGSAGDFQREWMAGGVRLAEPDALGAYLRETHVFVRRTREEVGRELPPVNTIVETVPHDAQAIADIEDLARQLSIRATTGQWSERGEALRELDWRLRRATGIAKARSVATYVRLLLEDGEAVLLAGWHRDVYEIWLEELAEHNPVLYTGSETAAQKDRARQAIMDGESRLLIMSLRSGSGLDGIQERMRVVVIGELDWSPGVHDQLIGRLDRDREGEPQQVTAIYLVSDDGADPPMIDVLGIKKSESTRIVDGDAAGLVAPQGDGSHLVRLAKRILAKRGRA